LGAKLPFGLNGIFYNAFNNGPTWNNNAFNLTDGIKLEIGRIKKRFEGPREEEVFLAFFKLSILE